MLWGLPAGQTKTHRPMRFVCNKASHITFAVVEDQEQVDKMLGMKNKIREITKVIFWNDKGLHHYDDSVLMGFKDVINLGIEYEKHHPSLFEKMIEKTHPEDPVLTYLFTRP
jgi:long-chain acyl-CoA synthetase